MPDLIITIGAPGCGKTTSVDRWMRAKPGRTRLSRDGLRVAIGYGGNRDDNPPEVEYLVTTAQYAAVRAWLEDGLDVAVDDTCQFQGTINAWEKIARACWARLIVWDYRDVPVDLCVARDLERRDRGGRYVGKVAIHRVAARCAKIVVPSTAIVRAMAA